MPVSWAMILQNFTFENNNKENENGNCWKSSLKHKKHDNKPGFSLKLKVYKQFNLIGSAFLLLIFPSHIFLKKKNKQTNTQL